MVQYLHRCAFGTAVHTWTKAINAEYFATWPGLTSELVRKHLPKLLETAKGHLKQDRKNIRLTKISVATAPLVLPSQQAPPAQYHQVSVETVELTGKVSTDQTDRFPVTSSRGSKYLMVLYDHDSNAIIPEPIKSRSEAELIRAYSVLHYKLTNRGLRPKFQMLDNECPAGLKDYIRHEGITFQIVPPHLHRKTLLSKLSRPSRTTLLMASPDVTLILRCTFGTAF